MTSFMSDHGFSFRVEVSFRADFEEFFRRYRFRLSNELSFPDGNLQTPRSTKNRKQLKYSLLNTLVCMRGCFTGREGIALDFFTRKTMVFIFWSIVPQPFGRPEGALPPMASKWYVLGLFWKNCVFLEFFTHQVCICPSPLENFAQS